MNSVSPILLALVNGLLLVVAGAWVLLHKLRPTEAAQPKVWGWVGLLAGAGLLLLCLG
ncbi:MAG: hypothetical protein JNM62_11955 [Flavobacteriales bacterium]|nr:hypothetical protein [Flavobacteriales bacterium]